MLPPSGNLIVGDILEDRSAVCFEPKAAGSRDAPISWSVHMRHKTFARLV